MNPKQFFSDLVTRTGKRSGNLAAPAGVFAYAFATLMTASMQARADDLDVYVKAAASGGTPVMSMIFDTSEEAANNLLKANGADADSVLNQSMANMKDALRAMMTSGPDNMRISLTDYDTDGTYDKGRILHEMVRVGDTVTSTPTGAAPLSSPIDVRIADGVDDAVQGTWGSGTARVTETDMYVPFRPLDGFTTDIAGSWTRSAGAFATDLGDACCDGIDVTLPLPDSYEAKISEWGWWDSTTMTMHGSITDSPNYGNRYNYYYSDPGANPFTGTQTFDLVSGSSSMETNPILFFVDTNVWPYQVLAYNDDRGTAKGCPVGYSLVTSGANKDKCKKGGSIVPQVILDQNSRVTVTGLQQYRWYILIIATRDAGKADTYTLSMSDKTQGKFYDFGSAWVPQASGFRFKDLNIPQGATITGARLVFTRLSNQGTPQVLTGIENSVTPNDFSVQDILTRSVNYGSGVSKPLIPNPNPEIDVQDLVASQVARTDWCPGSSMAFVVREDFAMGWSSDHVRIPTFEGDSANAAQLVIDYDITSGDPDACLQQTASLKIQSMSEDTTQFDDGTLDIDKAYMPDAVGDANIEDRRGRLWISYDTLVGLRFSLAEIPPGSTVASAKLYLTARSGAPQDIDIFSIETGGLAQAFVPDIGSLSTYAQGSADAHWKVTEWVDGTEYESVDLKDLVQDQIDQAGWTNDGTLGFVLRGSDTAGDMKACAWEYGPGGGYASTDPGDFGSCAARLVVEFNTNGADKITTKRRELIQTMETLKTSGRQPMGAAFLKTAEYLAGYFDTFPGDGIADDGTCDSGSPTVPTLNGTGCSSNTIVFIAENNEGAAYDKDAYKDEIAKFIQTVAPSSDFDCTVSGSGDNMNSQNCTDLIAAAIYDGGDGGLTQQGTGTSYSIKAYPINFGATAGGAGGGGGGKTDDSSSGGGTMRGIAANGGGQFYQSSSSGELTKQLLTIVKSIADQGAAVAAPGVSVNALNRFEHLDQLYYSLFKPSTNVDWTGNLKRFVLRNSEVRDIKDEAAVLTGTGGFFDTDSWSWWSFSKDGAEVTDGGAATETLTADRRIFTYLSGSSVPDYSAVGETELSEQVALTNTNIDEYTLGVDRLGLDLSAMSQPAIDAIRNRVVDFLTMSPNNQRFWGAAIHASPRIVAFSNEATNPILTVFYGDNRGFLHAIDAGEMSSTDTTVNEDNTGGDELFAYIPQELLLNAALLEANTQEVLVDGYIYGMDGDITLLRSDPDDDGNLDRVLLYAGMRRGGQNYHALDVTQARSDVAADSRTPTLQFVIEGGKGDFADMGQTWSAMSVNPIIWNGAPKAVLFFTGGYDASLHDMPTGETFQNVDQLGRKVYMVDAETGALLWDSTDDAPPEMHYSMTATPRLIDRNADGYVDAMYVVDLAGQVFRFDFNKISTGAADFVTQSVLVAQLGATAAGADGTIDNRRFYDSPSVAFVRTASGSSDILLALSSGWRETPFDVKTAEKFIFFRDRGAFDATPPANTTLTLDELTDLSDPNTVFDPAAAVGWYIDFGPRPNDAGSTTFAGEKGVGSPVIFNNAILIGTFLPKSAPVPNVCVPDIGKTLLYLLDFSGKGLLTDADGDGEFDRYLDIGLPGMADTPQVLFTSTGLDVAMGVQIMDGAGLCDADADCPFDPTLFNKLQRGRWYILDDE